MSRIETAVNKAQLFMWSGRWVQGSEREIGKAAADVNSTSVDEI